MSLTCCVRISATLQPIRKTVRIGRDALAMWKSLAARSFRAARTSTMGGENRRWLAPSATPWDDKDEDALNPAERLVMACHRDIYEYRHAPASLEGEAAFFNGYPRESCPRCGSPEIGGNGHDRNGVRRWRCRGCGRSFTPMTGTIFESHKIPVADWTEFLLEMVSFESLKGITRSNRRSETTPPYWLAKLFAIISGIQDEVVLSGNVQIDEKYYPLSDADQKRKADGTKLRGLSRNQICVAVGIDESGKSFCSRLGLGKPSEARTRAAYAKHIEEGSHLIHDMERSHRVLVRELSLTDEAHNSKLLKSLPDKENPLGDVNRLCFFLELFLNSHSGFDRAKLDGYLDLFHIMMNDPEEKMEKAAFILDRAMSYPYTLKYRTFYAKKTRS